MNQPETVWLPVCWFCAQDTDAEHKEIAGNKHGEFCCLCGTRTTARLYVEAVPVEGP